MVKIKFSLVDTKLRFFSLGSKLWIRVVPFVAVKVLKIVRLGLSHFLDEIAAIFSLRNLIHFPNCFQLGSMTAI